MEANGTRATANRCCPESRRWRLRIFTLWTTTTSCSTPSFAAYAKHVMDVPDIGWERLTNILDDAILHELGEWEFRNWFRRLQIPKPDGDDNYYS